MTDKKYKDKEWLREQYWEEDHTLKEIGKKCNVCSSTIANWMEKYSIKRGPDATEIDKSKENHPNWKGGKVEKDEGWLRKQYWEKERSAYEIAEMIDVSSNTIYKWMDKYNIDRRTRSESGKTWNHPKIYSDKKLRNRKWLKEQYINKNKDGPTIAKKCNVSQPVVYAQLKEFNLSKPKPRYQDKDWLKKQYIKKKKSAPQIADECGVSSRPIYYWLKKFNIKRRNRSEAQIKNEKVKDKSWLKKQYIEKEKSCREIGKKIDLAGVTIRNWLEKHGIERKHSYKGEKNPNWKKKVTLVCEWCGKEFEVIPSHADYRRFCSKKCLGEWRSKKRSGRNSPHWKGGVSKNMKKYQRERYRNNPKVRLNQSIRKSMSQALKNNKSGRHWENLVPYTLSSLKKHLEDRFEPRMKWKDYSYSGWQIDHIIPKSFFSYKYPEDKEFQKCWSLENLQPLWAEENMRKSDNLDWSKKQKEVAEKLDIDLER